MSEYIINGSTLSDIASAIRNKTGKSSTMRPVDMPAEIGSISGGDSQVAVGTFQSASEQYGIVSVDCGFEPDVLLVILPFSNGDTVSYWWREAGWSSTSAIWCVRPAEPNAYVVALGRTSGETGIQAINSNGFSFMSNGANTRGVTCKYFACKYE